MLGWIQSVTLRAPMDLNPLSLFVTVAEASSFSTAAAKLGVRRSSVSRGVAALERALDVQLFSRTTRQVALTTAGAALYAKVAPSLASLKESIGTLPEREKLPSGELRITAPVDIGVIVLPGIIAGFSTRYPAVTVDAWVTNRRVDLVAEGFDAALRVSMGRLSDSTLAREDVAAGRLVRVLPRNSIGSGALYLVHPPAQRVPRKVTVFRDYLVEHFAAHPLVGRQG